jgi:hypothetical protein
VLPEPGCVNAGSGAVRVVEGAALPPFSLGAGVVDVVLVVLAGVERVLVVGAVVAVLCSGSGVLATVTVFVPPPQPASSSARAIPSSWGRVLRKPRLIALMVFAANHLAPGNGLDVFISDC